MSTVRNTIEALTKTALTPAVLIPLAVCAIVFFSGCDFFDERSTHIESNKIMRDISQINKIPPEEKEAEKPQVYKLPPKIIEGKVGEIKDAKLFYFTKHHSPKSLKELLDEQFSKKFFDKKGKPYPVKDYGVSINHGTNQLVVSCPSVADAEEVKTFLQQTDVPPIQVKIDCLISEVYSDHTMDWETTLEIQNLLGMGFTLRGKKEGDRLLPAFPGAALRDIARSSFGLKTGLVLNEGENGHEFSALVDLLVSKGYLKILMNPSLEVVNGRTARIETEEQVPIDRIQNIHPVSGAITYETIFEPVIDSLEITPTVFGDGYISIKTKAIIGSKSTPEGVKQVPIVTKREVNIEENRIRPGESLVIGGITKTEKRSVVRGVPFLKDIPIIGIIFSSKDFEERGKEVLFIITPTISTGGVSNEQMVNELREKHDPVNGSRSIFSTITDPHGQKRYTDIVEEEATEATAEKIKAQRRVKELEEELKKSKQKPDYESRIDAWMNKKAGDKKTQ